MTGLHKRSLAPGSVHFSHLREMGTSLAGACIDICRDPTPERCNLLLMKLRGAEEGVRQFRRRLIADEELARDSD